ncbi:glycosyl hydrolase family 18 protein [Streptomyces sp. NPDC058583]|uniref:glycosyl hydrolase family 18 protein n=1 Tax=unclassified Streptomyces TaxID=2593676 RepID=UPI003650A458
MAAAVGLALLTGLLSVVLLPVKPAAADPSNLKLLTWNTWDGKSDTLNKVPGLIKDHDLDVVALQEVTDGDLLGHAPAASFDVANRSPSGTRVGNWRVEEFHWDDGITVYRIRTGPNRRSIAIATKKRAASHDDLHAVQVRGDASGKAFPAFGIKLDGNWYYSIHASTQAKRSNNNADTLIEDISGLHEQDGFKAPWAIMGDFNRFPDEKSRAFINQRNKLKGAKKRNFPDDQGALTSVLDLEAKERVVFSGAPTHKKGAELDFLVDGGAAEGFNAKRLKTSDGSDHYGLIFEKGAEEPDTCTADDGAGASGAARAAAADVCPVEPALPAATVSLGDSYISGEGGRWQGNANAKADGPDGDLDPDNDAWGTDRAAHSTQVYEKNAAARADQSTCRPDGMTATKGVDTPYCLIYDEQGREVMGKRHPRRVVGYFTGWRTGRNGQPTYLPRSIPWGQVSHVNYAFAHVDGSNRISVGDVNDPDNPATGMTWPHVPGAEMDGSLPYKGNFNLLNKYKKEHPRVRTLISVGGWAETGGTLKPDGSREKTGGLYRVTNREGGSVNQPAINTFADSVVTFLRTYGFNGVDIDYEYPTSLLDAGNPEDWPIANPRRKGLNAGNTALMKTLREKLDAASAADNAYYQLTAAASASGYLLRGQEDFRALQYLDFVNTMSYDYHGSWNNYVGPQAPLYDDGKDVELAATGIYDKVKNPEYQQEGFFNTDWS